MEHTRISFGAPIAPGTPVEVRSRFDATWARGFVVSRQFPHGYTVRRVSDGAELPVTFAPDDLRPAAGLPFAW